MRQLTSDNPPFSIVKSFRHALVIICTIAVVEYGRLLDADQKIMKMRVIFYTSLLQRIN